MNVNASPSVIRNIIIVVAAAFVAYLIYYYTVRGKGKKDTSRAHMTPLAKAVVANDTEQCATTYTLKQLSPWAVGGEYTIMGWLYVNNWDSGNIKHVFSLTAGTSTSPTTPNVLLYVAIDQSSPTLIVRFLSQNEISTASSSTLTSTAARNDAMPGYFMGPAMKNVVENVGVANCDIEDITLQRWIFLALVVRGQVVDVYLDGKLARECVLPSLPAVSSSAMNLRVGAAPITAITDSTATQYPLPSTMPSFGGYISNIQTYSKALAPDEIVSAYQAGPKASTGGWLSNLFQVFSVTVTFSNADGNNSYALKL